MQNFDWCNVQIESILDVVSKWKKSIETESFYQYNIRYSCLLKKLICHMRLIFHESDYEFDIIWIA